MFPLPTCSHWVFYRSWPGEEAHCPFPRHEAAACSPTYLHKHCPEHLLHGWLPRPGPRHLSPSLAQAPPEQTAVAPADGLHPSAAPCPVHQAGHSQGLRWAGGSARPLLRPHRAHGSASASELCREQPAHRRMLFPEW